MKKSIIFAFAFALCANAVFSQNELIKFDVETGIGSVFSGWGDGMMVASENELNYKINNYFSASALIGIGRGIVNNPDSEWQSNNNYLQSALNLFFSPFRNNRRNNFKIGTGVSFINENHSYVSAIRHYPSYNMEYTMSEQSYMVCNLIIEDEFKITPRFLIGVKIFTTTDFSMGYLTGGFLKFGVIL